MRYLFLTIALSLFVFASHAQDNKSMELDKSLFLDAKLPFNPDVKKGMLKNGITYIIRTNKKPENRAELRLVVNVGSMMEKDNQQGLAHFVEHMAFNGTKNFKKSEIVDYLESIGVKFGPHLNAYTSFDETVYMIQIPTDDEDIIEKGFQILEDWAHVIAFEEEEIDKERGVVVEEWRLGRGANARMREKYFPVLFKDSRYAERLPIGKKEVIEGAAYETIREFYNDWYRPDLMCVIAVGDFDADDIEAKIKAHFGKLAEGTSETRPEYDVPNHKETVVSIATDKEATGNVVQLIYKHW